MDGPPSSPLQQRRSEFRKLLVHVSKRLDESAVSEVEYLREMPSRSTTDKKRGGFEVLTALEKEGHISPTNTKPLVELLQEIKRHDLAGYVTEYQSRYPGELERGWGWSVFYYPCIPQIIILTSLYRGPHPFLLIRLPK